MADNLIRIERAWYGELYRYQTIDAKPFTFTTGNAGYRAVWRHLVETEDAIKRHTHLYGRREVSAIQKYESLDDDGIAGIFGLAASFLSCAQLKDEFLAEFPKWLKQAKDIAEEWRKKNANRPRVLCDRTVTAFPAKRYLAGAGWRDVDCIRLEKQTVTVTDTEPWSDNRLAVTVANLSGYSVMNNDVPPVLENLEGKPHKDNPDYIPACIANPAYRPNGFLLTRRAKRQPSPLLASLIEDDVIDEIVDADAVYEQVYKQEKARIQEWAKRTNRQFKYATVEDVIRHATAKRLAGTDAGTSTSQPFKYATQEDIDRARTEPTTPLKRTRLDYVPFVDEIKGQRTAEYGDVKESAPIDGGPSDFLFNDRDARTNSANEFKAFTREQAELERKQETVDAVDDRRAELEDDIELAKAEHKEMCSKYGSNRTKMDSHGQKEFDATSKALRAAQARLQHHEREAKAHAKEDRVARFRNSRLWRAWLLAELKKAYGRYPDGSAPCCSAADCSVGIPGAEKLERERLALDLIANCGVGLRNKRKQMDQARSSSFEVVFGDDADSKDNVMGMSLENYLSITRPWGYTEGLWKRGQLERAESETETKTETETETDKRRLNESQQEHVTRLTGNMLERERKHFRNDPLNNVAILHQAGSEQEGDGGDADELVSTMSDFDWTRVTDERMRTEHYERFWQQEQTKVKGKRKRKRGIPIPAMDPRDEFYDRIIGQGIAVWRERWQEDKILKPKSAFLRGNPAARDGEGLPSEWGPMPSEKSKWMKEVTTLAEIAAHRVPSGNNSNERSNVQWESFAREYGSVLKAESFRSANLETIAKLFLHPDVPRKTLPRKATAESIERLNEQTEAIDACRRELCALWSWCEDMEAHGEDGCALIDAELTSRGYVLTEDGYM